VISIRLLERDLLKKALPKALCRIKTGDILVVETHLYRSSFLKLASSELLIPNVTKIEKHVSRLTSICYRIAEHFSSKWAGRKLIMPAEKRQWYRLEWKK